MPTVLVVEDDPKLASFITRVLHEEQFDATVAGSIGAARAALARPGIDVAVLDRMLPDGDGIALCARPRGHAFDVPMIMLTALGDLVHRVEGLDAGADDYLTKPFEIDELLARLRALLRRTTKPLRDAGPLRVDLKGRRAFCDDRLVELTVREFDLLAHLIDGEGAVLPRSRLLASVWGSERDPGTNVIEVHMSRLRAKLGHAAWTVETVRGEGYRFRRERSP